MGLQFAATFSLVLFFAAPSLDYLGARAQGSRSSNAEESTLPGCSCDNMCIAAETNDPGSIRTCVNVGVDVCDCECTDDGQGLMHYSVIGYCKECIHILTSAPADCPCDQLDDHENTPLHIAALRCEAGMMDDLLTAGCKVDATTGEGETPLCLAALPPNNTDCGAAARSIVMDDPDTASFDCPGTETTPCRGTTNRMTHAVLEEYVPKTC